MLLKTTNKLFRNKYPYKLVLICAGASWFRGGDMDSVLEQLNKVSLSDDKRAATPYYSAWKNHIKTQDDLDYAFRLQHELKNLPNVDVRVETPWVSIYATTWSEIQDLIKLDNSKVKYICVPPDSVTLTQNTIIMQKMPFDYRITVGKTLQNYSAFVGWAEKNKNLKLTKACKRELNKDRSWGGTHFYITGDNNLLLAKMHLGGSINKVERIIKVQS